MYKKVIQDIKELGFELSEAGKIDDEGAFYDVFNFYHVGTTLEITFEYDKDGNILKSYIEFENVVLKGIKCTISEIKTLIKFIYNIDYENRT